MKKQYLILLAIVFMLAACTKNTSIKAAFSLVLNGVQLYGNNDSAIYHVNGATGEHTFTGKFYVGSQAVKNYVQLNFTSINYILPGTYQYNNTYPNATTGTLSVISDTLHYVQSSGNFQITSIDTGTNKISGTFQFNAINTANAADVITVSDGKFTDLNYHIQ